MNKFKDKLIYLPLTIGGIKYATPDNIRTGISLNNFINFGLNFLVVIGILAALLFVILGAIKWITSGGDKTKVEEARGTLTNAIIGLIIVVFSIVIIRVIGQLIGSPALQFIFPSNTTKPPIPETLYCPEPGRCTNSCPVHYIHDGHGNCVFEY